jgi:uncharacterized protein
MLELRPNCEWCDRDLPPQSSEARICSYECTYCATCVDTLLKNVCPTCGGGFVARPIRPLEEWRPGWGLGRRHHPASTTRRRSKWTIDQVRAHAERIAGIPAEHR